MKKMTCNELGGACELVFQANTFEEMASLSKQHGTAMFKAGDEAHLKVIGEMRELMQTPSAIEKWMEEKRKAFESLPDTPEVD